MILGVTGNVRKLPRESFAEHYERILQMIEHEMIAARFVPTRIACGRKNGVDRAAINYAKLHNLPCDHFAVRFSLAGHVDAMLVFDDGSRTTRDVIDHISREGKLVHRVISRSRRPTDSTATTESSEDAADNENREPTASKEITPES